MPDWTRMSPEEKQEHIREANRKETEEQGLPEHVEDPVVLERIAEILRPVLFPPTPIRRRGRGRRPT